MPIQTYGGNDKIIVDPASAGNDVTVNVWSGDATTSSDTGGSGTGGDCISISFQDSTDQTSNIYVGDGNNGILCESPSLKTSRDTNGVDNADARRRR